MRLAPSHARRGFANLCIIIAFGLQRAGKAAGSVRNISREQKCRCLNRQRQRFPAFIILCSVFGVESSQLAAEFTAEETGKDKFRQIGLRTTQKT